MTFVINWNILLDELDCSVINFGDGDYQAQNPDFMQGYTNVSVNISIIYMDNIDEHLMKMSIKVLLQLKWFDTRLKYKNLNPNVTNGSNLDNNQKNQVNYLKWSNINIISYYSWH